MTLFSGIAARHSIGIPVCSRSCGVAPLCAMRPLIVTSCSMAGCVGWVGVCHCSWLSYFSVGSPLVVVGRI